VTEAVAQFEGYSYRTTSRYGSRVQLRVEDGLVSVTGPRLAPSLYGLWLGAQAALMVSVLPVLLIEAVLRRRWRYVVGSAGVLALHGAIGGFGAGCLWELQGLIDFGAGKEGTTATFPVNAVRDVRIGRGWARKGLGVVILPYVAGINAMAKGLAVSFEAPDEVTGRDVVYALHMRTPEDASALAMALGGCH
jgi:hypothetical protein